MTGSQRAGILKRLLTVAIVGVLFITGVGFGRMYRVAIDVRRNVVDDDSAYVPAYQRISGPQVVMVYIGSAGCAESNQPFLPGAIERIKLKLAADAAVHGMSFKAVGVALDWDPEIGFEHLQRFGRFDEISSGYNWGNTMGLRYIWSDSVPQPVTPQVLVYERVFISPQDSTVGLRYGEERRRMLARTTGAQGIRAWSQADALVEPHATRAHGAFRDSDSE